MGEHRNVFLRQASALFLVLAVFSVRVSFAEQSMDRTLDRPMVAQVLTVSVPSHVTATNGVLWHRFKEQTVSTVSGRVQQLIHWVGESIKGLDQKITQTVMCSSPQ